MKRCIYVFSALVLLVILPGICSAQKQDSSLRQATLQQCVQYALSNQPLLKQSQIDEEITEAAIRSKLSEWYPQIGFDYNLQHNFQLQSTVFAGNTVKIGVNNTSYGYFSATQNIFNRDVLLASRSARDVRLRAKQTTAANKIDVTVNVSKAFYDVLLTEKQLDIIDEDIILLEASLKNAYNQYKGGIVDKIDYKRATISLNNTNAAKRAGLEQLKAKYAYLKQQMGYPDSLVIDLQWDSTEMVKEAFLDTTEAVNYSNRIELQLLETQQRLQQANLKYYKWAYIPSVSAFGSYNLNYFNNEFSKLYNQNFPQSFAGLRLSFPIFQGWKRNQDIKQASLEYKRVDYDIQLFKNSVNAEYQQAMALYKSALNNYSVLKENLELAMEVYTTIQLQYKQGVKTYLEVVTSEADLKTAQVNYVDALFQVLISKVDVQKALGQIQY